MRLCKFVSLDRTTQAPPDSAGYLRDNTRIFWENGKTYKPRPLKDLESYSLCSDTVLHAFLHQTLAGIVLEYWNKGWKTSCPTYRIPLEVTGNVVIHDGIYKVGCSEITVVKELPRVLTSNNPEILLWILLRFEATKVWEEYLENPGKMQEDAKAYLSKPLYYKGELIYNVEFQGNPYRILWEMLPTYPFQEEDMELLQTILDKFQEHYGLAVDF